jgi:hypothetical protein
LFLICKGLGGINFVFFTESGYQLDIWKSDNPFLRTSNAFSRGDWQPEGE